MVDYLAILVAAVAAYVVGALWYGPIFGKQWRHLMGHTGGNMGMPQAMLGGALSTLVLVYFFAMFMDNAVVTMTGDAISFALAVSIGVIGMVLLNSVWYEGRPWKLYFINLGHYVVALLAAALVLLYW